MSSRRMPVLIVSISALFALQDRLVVHRYPTLCVTPDRLSRVAQYPGQNVRYHNDVSLHVGHSDSAILQDC
jgi:hypothetical protein